jgi:phosphoglycerol transferase MdoB-like AlkP superfamily enzyme
MHPRKSIPSEATGAHITGFPEGLRRHGYRALHFTGSDPDWDSQRVWLDRWYDEVHFDPRHGERDRAVFRAASERIREVARDGKPFLAYLSSISNHHPFRIPEAELAITPGATPVEALHNTMHYTDDVVRELYESLSKEAWFDDTIWIVTGDHGFDLADRGEAGGHENLRHETTWVPLLIHGRDPRLPRGRVSVVSAHIDLAPTIAELASVWDDNSYMGHSLLHVDGDAETLVLRHGNYAFETREHSLFKPAGDKAWIYAASDRVQVHALSEPPRLLDRAELLAKAYEATLVYAIDNNRVLPPPELAFRGVAWRPLATSGRWN